MNNSQHFIATTQHNCHNKYISKIEQTSHTSSIKDINTQYSQPSNLIPHFWNYKIVDKEGSPDLPCIMILSELFGWFRSLSHSNNTLYNNSNATPKLIGDKLAISYEFLSNKLNFNKERIRRNLVKLETLGILSRDVKNIALENGSRIKQLYISIDQEFFQSCFKNPDLDIRVRDSDFSYSNSSDFKRTPLPGGEHISKKNNIRSNESSFFNNDLKDKESLIASNPSPQQKKSKALNDFYPLNKEDCRELQIISGREFGLTAMNEILKNMASRVTTAEFWSKKGFMAYMSKAFRYELRDAVKTNNETFKIKANYSEEENNVYKQEKFLTEIESCMQVSPEWHLKKKLASVLERKIAYNLLFNYKRSERVGDLYRIYLSKKIEIGEMDKHIILNQVRATQERVGGDGNIEYIEKVEFIFDKKEFFNKKKKEKPKLPTNIWGEIRRELIEIYGEDGKALDFHWISKLEAKIDKNIKLITLKSPNEFTKRYIEERFLSLLTKIANSVGFELLKIQC